MRRLLHEYRSAARISRLNRLRFVKLRHKRSVRVAIIDGPLDARRARVCRQHVEVTEDGAIRQKSTQCHNNSPAVAHCCAVWDRLRMWEPLADIEVFSIFETTLETSACKLFYAIVSAVESGVDVLNISVGVDDMSQEVLSNMRAACNLAEANRTIIVAASKRRQPLLPEILDNVLPVRGEDLGSAGVFFVEKTPRFCVIANGGIEVVRAAGKNHVLEGSSFAAAEVSGIVARLVRMHGQLSVPNCRDLLAQWANGIW